MDLLTYALLIGIIAIIYALRSKKRFYLDTILAFIILSFVLHSQIPDTFSRITVIIFGIIFGSALRAKLIKKGKEEN